MNRQSPKKVAEQAQRRELIEALQRAGLWECQIGPVLRRAYIDGSYDQGGFGIRAADVDCLDAPSGIHERRKRSSGGSLTMLANLMPACTWHNQWVEREPELAHRLGLVVRPGDHEWFMLGRDRGGF